MTRPTPAVPPRCDETTRRGLFNCLPFITGQTAPRSVPLVPFPCRDRTLPCSLSFAAALPRCAAVRRPSRAPLCPPARLSIDGSFSTVFAPGRAVSSCGKPRAGFVSGALSCAMFCQRPSHSNFSAEGGTDEWSQHRRRFISGSARQTRRQDVATNKDISLRCADWFMGCHAFLAHFPSVFASGWCR